MSESGIPSHSSSEKVELSIHIDSELLDQIKHLTNDPSKVIETAIKQWLRGERREDELALGLRRNPPVPPRGEWNDWGFRVGDGGARKSAWCKVSGCEIFDGARSGADLAAKATGCWERTRLASQPRNSVRWGKKCASQSPTWVVGSLRFWRNFQTRSLICADL